MIGVHVISGAEVYYDKRFLFGLPYESEVYQRILEYFREEDIRIILKTVRLVIHGDGE